MPLSFMNASVTVLRPATKQSRGSTVLDYGTGATSHVVNNCMITGLSSMQDRDGRVLQVSDRFTLRAPYGADIKAGDRIIHDGVTYEIEGDPRSTKSPTGRVSNVRCELSLWRG